MNAHVLKISLGVIINEFTYLLNVCKNKSIFQEKWKYVSTVPIPKQGNIKDVNNLTPISLLPNKGKIFKRFINKHLTFHMEGNNLFFENQGDSALGTQQLTLHIN